MKWIRLWLPMCRWCVGPSLPRSPHRPPDCVHKGTPPNHSTTLAPTGQAAKGRLVSLVRCDKPEHWVSLGWLVAEGHGDVLVLLEGVVIDEGDFAAF